MGTIPLPALGIRPPQQPDVLGQAGKIMQLRNLGAQQQMIPGELQAQQQQLELGQQNIQKNQFEIQDREAGMKAMQQWDGKDYNQLPELLKDNKASFGAVTNARAAVVKQQTEVLAMNKAQRDAAAQKNDYLLGKLQAATDPKLPDAELPQRITQAVQESINDGYLDPQHAQAIQQMLQQATDPTALRLQLSYLEKGLMGHTEQLNQANKEQEIANQKKTADAAMLRAQNTSPSAEGVAAKAAQGDPAAIATQNEITRQAATKAAAESTAKMPNEMKLAGVRAQATIDAQKGLLTDQAKSMAAENYFQTGQLPAGMRSPGAISEIINRAGQLHPGESLSANKAAYEANKKSYDNVTGTLDTLTSFEQSGLKNLKQFTDLASKLPDTGVPWLNTPVRDLNKNLVGAEYMPAIEAARSVALREIARVTNDPKLTGALTDTARGEVSSFSPANATLPQIKRVVEVLTNDMANVHSSLAIQKVDIGGRLGINPQGKNAGGAQGGGSRPQSNAAPPKDLGAASGKPEGATGTLPDGTKVIVKGGRIIAQ